MPASEPTPPLRDLRDDRRRLARLERAAFQALLAPLGLRVEACTGSGDDGWQLVVRLGDDTQETVRIDAGPDAGGLPAVTPRPQSGGRPATTEETHGDSVASGEEQPAQRAAAAGTPAPITPVLPLLPTLPPLPPAPGEEDILAAHASPVVTAPAPAVSPTAPPAIPALAGLPTLPPLPSAGAPREGSQGAAPGGGAPPGVPFASPPRSLAPSGGGNTLLTIPVLGDGPAPDLDGRSGESLRVPPIASVRPNPFIAAATSGEERAVRLARTLVSDMKAYAPALHANALAEGRDAMHAAFKAPLAAARELYHRQVDGASVPNRDDIFHAALNDLLAHGEHWF